MKTNIFSLFSSFLLIAALSACDNHNYGPEIQARGQLSFADLKVEVDDSEVLVESRADGDLNLADFIVTVTDNQGAIVLQNSFGKLPEVIDLNVGSYKVAVESHEVQPAEFSKPYYKGALDIKIEKNQITNVGTVDCKFASICVSMDYSDAIWPLLGDDFEVRVRINEDAELTFKPDLTNRAETRKLKGYFKAVSDTYAHTLIVNPVGTVYGIEVNRLFMAFDNVMAGEHHTVKFKLKNPVEPPQQTGSLNPEEDITIDHNVSEYNVNYDPGAEEPNLGSGDRPGQETPETPEQPDDPGEKTILIESASPDLNLEAVNNVVGVTQNDGHEYKVRITSQNPLAKLHVKIISESLNDEFLREVDLAADFDLDNPENGVLEEKLREMGFPVKEQVVGQTEVMFNITEFVPLLNIYAGELHQFELTVEDDKGNKEIKTLKFQS